MAQKRKAIRQAVVDAVKAVYSGTVFDGLSADMQDIQEAITVRIVDGESGGGVNPIISAKLSIGYHKIKATQSELDEIDILVSPIISRSISTALLSGVVFDRYYYEEDPSGQLLTLFTEYKIIYKG